MFRATIKGFDKGSGLRPSVRVKGFEGIQRGEADTGSQFGIN